MQKLLKVDNLNIFIEHCEKNNRHELHLLKNLSFELEQGELLALVGASGSGKSLLAHSLLGILPQNSYQSGKAFFCGQELNESFKAKLRGQEISLIPQSVSFLNPLMRIGKQIIGEERDNKKEARLDYLLKLYDLSPDIKYKFPHELSGGMIRRVLICTALIQNPKLIIADEPTPGIHSLIARDVMQHLFDLTNENRGVLLITHDLELALEFAHRLLIFNQGEIIEEVQLKNKNYLDEVKNPYTKALLAALPKNY